VAKIAVICDREFFSPFDQRVYKEVISLKKNGHDIEIITPHKRTEIREFEGIKVHCLTTSGPPISTAYRLIKRALKKEYDLYYCHELDPLIYSLILKWYTKKPIIWDCHEYLVPMKKELQGNLSAVMTEISMKIAARRVEHIITVDNVLGRQLASMNHVTVVPNYPTINDFPLMKRKKNLKKPNLLYVGGFTIMRGFKIMIEAFHEVKKQFNVELTLVGGFYDKELEKWAKDFDKKNNLEINWLGWINYRDLAPIFSNASLGLCLLQNQERYNRAIATKIFEYMIMGVPVLASKGHFVDRLIQRGKCGKTVNGNSVEEVVNGINDLLETQELEKLGINGQKFSREKFIWEKQEKKLVDIVDNLISSN